MYSIQSRVRYSECDLDSTLTIPALINYLQDCSTFHCEDIGRGVAYVTEHHLAWFVAAWQVRVNRLPRFCEQICVSTWSSMRNSTLANRYFRVTTIDGEELVLADSLWFTFDTLHGRPVRIPEEELVYFTEEEPPELPPTQRKLRLVGEGHPKPSIVVAEHHLDTNQHVNNGQYIAMADSVVRTHDEGFCANTLLVQYKKAAKLGDVVVPVLYTETAGYAVDLTDNDGDTFAIVRMERS